MAKRIIFDVFLLLSVFVLPWWISLLLMFLGIFAFKNFYEFIVANIVVYSLYSIPSPRWISSPLFFFSVVALSYVLIQYIKDNIILYKK